MPNAELVVIINTGLKPEVTEGMKEAARYYGGKIVELHDIEKIAGHPTAKGMMQIKDQILEQLGDRA